MPLRAEDIPEHHRAGLGRVALDPQSGGALSQPGIGRARHGQAGQVALDVGQKDGDAQAGESLGQHLQGDGFAGARGSGDQPMAIGVAGFEITGGFTPADE